MRHNQGHCEHHLPHRALERGARGGLGGWVCEMLNTDIKVDEWRSAVNYGCVVCMKCSSAGTWIKLYSRDGLAEDAHAFKLDNFSIFSILHFQLCPLKQIGALVFFVFSAGCFDNEGTEKKCKMKSCYSCERGDCWHAVWLQNQR